MREYRKSVLCNWYRALAFSIWRLASGSKYSGFDYAQLQALPVRSRRQFELDNQHYEKITD